MRGVGLKEVEKQREATMELKRYKKSRNEHGYAPLEVCDSVLFVVFWSDCKYVSARDAAGVEWLLQRETALRDIEAGDAGLIRVHQSCLVRRDSIDSFRKIPPRAGCNGYGVARVAGHDYRVARNRWCELTRG
ncbi:hypothetical protein ACIQVE_12150 [Pseudomonas sp. NPDC098747]|uniref:hypothetical protein n=1 Tax=Pseudomonas sp. NPDC098747 TaxID=3364487 RepID=UPI00383BDA7C